MALLKIARASVNPEHIDSWIDGAGYMACGGEISTHWSTRGKEPMEERMEALKDG